MGKSDPNTPKAKLKLSIPHFAFTFLHEVSLKSKSHLRVELCAIYYTVIWGLGQFGKIGPQ